MKLAFFFSLFLSLSISANANLKAYKDTLGQKVIVDIRYFCPNKTQPCEYFQTQLSPELKKLIQMIRPAGIILFSENIKDSEQLLRFNYKLQEYAKKIGLAPLFIAVDQEGGRVSRLIASDFPPFSGNMAIGATYASHKSYFATQVGLAMGQQLSTLGINVNFAPSVDVNNNPHNPIINVRSFSQDPSIVAEQGAAFIDALQSQNVIGALKHFPGHGDTSVDSHVGLPSVDHERSQINEIDLYPFKAVIDKQAKGQPEQAVAMMMTAHIQYPQLDNTKLINKFGSEIVVPATLSSKILKDVLRGELKFEGLIISDAMDMAGISQFFDQKMAMKQAFTAGVDIALMPYTLKNETDILALNTIIQELAEEAMINKDFGQALLKSGERIEKIKGRFPLLGILDEPLSSRLDSLHRYVQKQEHKALAENLANSAITKVKNDITRAQMSNVRQVIAIMPDKLRCNGLENEFANMRAAITPLQLMPKIQCFSLLSDDLSQVTSLLSDKPSQSNLESSNISLSKDSLFIVGDITPQLASYETRGFEGILWSERRNRDVQINTLKQLEERVTKASIPSVFVAMRSPYVLSDKVNQYSAAYATYDYQVVTDSFDSKAFEALLTALFINNDVKGSLPVTID